MVFEHYSKRPEFRTQATKTGAHDNRFVNGNYNTLASSKNTRTKSVQFNKYMPRRPFIEVDPEKQEFLTPEEERALSQQVNFPFSYQNDVPPAICEYFKRRK